MVISDVSEQSTERPLKHQKDFFSGKNIATLSKLNLSSVL